MHCDDILERREYNKKIYYTLIVLKNGEITSTNESTKCRFNLKFWTYLGRIYHYHKEQNLSHDEYEKMWCSWCDCVPCVLVGALPLRGFILDDITNQSNSKMDIGGENKIHNAYKVISLFFFLFKFCNGHLLWFKILKIFMHKI